MLPLIRSGSATSAKNSDKDIIFVMYSKDDIDQQLSAQKKRKCSHEAEKMFSKNIKSFTTEKTDVNRVSCSLFNEESLSPLVMDNDTSEMTFDEYSLKEKHAGSKPVSPLAAEFHEPLVRGNHSDSRQPGAITDSESPITIDELIPLTEKTAQSIPIAVPIRTKSKLSDNASVILKKQAFRAISPDSLISPTKSPEKDHRLPSGPNEFSPFVHFIPFLSPADVTTSGSIACSTINVTDSAVR
jgi:hypothetical protein